jgi:hypothetical protein
MYQQRFLALHREYARCSSLRTRRRAYVAREVHDDALQRRHDQHDVQEWLRPAEPEAVSSWRCTGNQTSASCCDVGAPASPCHHRPGLLPALAAGRRHRALSGVNRGAGSVGIAERCSIMTLLILFRIAQEALRNVVKHAGATHAVGVDIARDDLILTIKDRAGSTPATRIAPADSGSSVWWSSATRRRALRPFSKPEVAPLFV